MCEDPTRVCSVVKQLQATDLSCPAEALSRAFDVIAQVWRTLHQHFNSVTQHCITHHPLNCTAHTQHRLADSLDSFGLGRRPWVVEPTVVVLFTHGGVAVTSKGTTTKLQLATGTSHGASLCAEPFRWDSKLFVLLLPSHTAAQATKPGKSAAIKAPLAAELSALCDKTGGRCYSSTR